MRPILRLLVVAVGGFALAFIVGSVASETGIPNAAHLAVGTPKALQVASPTPEPTPVPTAEATPRAHNEASPEPGDGNPSPPPAAATSETFSLLGDTATFSCSGNVISLVSAVPNGGFAVEAEREDGDREVNVRFESDSHRSEIQATCVAGQVHATEIREESE